MAGLGTKFNLNKDTHNIIINDTYGVGIKAVSTNTRQSSSTMVVDACKLANKKSEIDEEIRLFYVAMTRAKNLLSLVGRYKVSNIAKSATSAIYTSKNYFDLCFKAFSSLDIAQIEQKYNGKDMASFVINQNKLSNAVCNIYSVDSVFINTVDADNRIRISAEDTPVVKEILAMAEYKLPPSIAIKNTVTKMLTEENDYNNYISAPKNLDTLDPLDSVDALTLGTAYHSIMQSVNYHETREEITTLIEELYANGTIPKEVTIDKENIYNAIKIVGRLVTSNEIMKEKQFIFRDKHKNLVANSDIEDYVIVQGVIDLIIITKDGAIIIDYKTNKSNEDFLKKHYKLQLDLYKNAFEKAYQKNVIRKYLYSFTLNKLIEID